MKVSNGVYKQLKINWAGVTFPLKEGSPVSLAGAVANNGNAIGLVPQTYTEEPLMKSIYVLVGGDVDLAEVETLYGSSLTTAAKGAMSGINFYKPNGTVDDSADSSYGGIFEIHITSDRETGIYTMSESYNQIKAAVDSGKTLTLKVSSLGSDGIEYTIVYYGVALASGNFGGVVTYGVHLKWISLPDFEELVYKFYATDPDDPMATQEES